MRRSHVVVMVVAVTGLVAAACVPPPSGDGGSRPSVRLSVGSVDGFVGQARVELQLETPPSATQVRIANGTSVEAADWVEVSERVDWDLDGTGPDGPRTVSAQVIDGNGRTSRVARVDVVLDRTPPELTFDSHGPGSTVDGTGGALIEFSGTVSDAHSGVEAVRFGQLDVPVDEWALAELSDGTWTGSAEAVGASDHRTIGVEAIDRVGNTTSIERNLWVEATPPGDLAPRPTTLEVAGELYDALVLIDGRERLVFSGDRRGAFADRQSVFGLPRDPIAPDGFLRQIDSVTYDPASDRTTVFTSEGDVLAAIARFAVPETDEGPVGGASAGVGMEDCLGLEDLTRSRNGSSPRSFAHGQTISAELDLDLPGPPTQVGADVELGLSVAAGVHVEPPGWAGALAVAAYTWNPALQALEFAKHSRDWTIAASIGVCADAQLTGSVAGEWTYEFPVPVRVPGPPAGPIPTSFALSGELFVDTEANVQTVRGRTWAVLTHRSTKDDPSGEQSWVREHEFPHEPFWSSLRVGAGTKAKLSWQVLDVRFGIGSEFIEGELSANLVGYPDSRPFAGIWACPQAKLSLTPGLSLMTPVGSYGPSARIELLELIDLDNPAQTDLNTYCLQVFSGANPPGPGDPPSGPFSIVSIPSHRWSVATDVPAGGADAYVAAFAGHDSDPSRLHWVLIDPASAAIVDTGTFTGLSPVWGEPSQAITVGEWVGVTASLWNSSTTVPIGRFEWSLAEGATFTETLLVSSGMFAEPSHNPLYLESISSLWLRSGVWDGMSGLVDIGSSPPTLTLHEDNWPGYGGNGPSVLGGDGKAYVWTTDVLEGGPMMLVFDPSTNSTEAITVDHMPGSVAYRSGTKIITFGSPTPAIYDMTTQASSALTIPGPPVLSMASSRAPVVLPGGDLVFIGVDNLPASENRVLRFDPQRPSDAQVASLPAPSDDGGRPHFGHLWHSTGVLASGKVVTFAFGEALVVDPDEVFS